MGVPLKRGVRAASVIQQMIKPILCRISRKLVPVATALVTFAIGFGSFHFWNPVVLEVTNQGYGMVYPKAEILELRVYQNGRVEYDVYPPWKDSLFNLGYWFPMRHSKLSSSEVKELIVLAEQPDFLSARESYEAGYMHIDDSWKTTIKFAYRGQERKITAINFWDITRPQDSSEYPASMVSLLKKVRGLRVKLTGQP